MFKYCDDNALPLLDLADLSTTLRFLGSDAGKPVLEEYGGMSSASLGVLIRSIVTLEQEGADVFFGEPEFDVGDLLRTTPEGEGVISILELSDVMDKPSLFSTFMLWMLAQLYHTLPEVGDLAKPKLCFFFDEAHLLFDDASKALLDQVERTARLIRSKGVGVYFVTQTPTDIPASVLAQLGNRVEHALRVFTPQDSDALKKTARTFPITTFYDVEQAITSLGIGEALVTVLSSRGVPTPLAATRLIPPDSLMAALDPIQFQGRVATSALTAKYGQTVDRESAHEIITARITAARQVAADRASADPNAEPPPVMLNAAQQRREIERQAHELERQREAAERAARAEQRDRAATERERKVDERARQRSVDTAIRTGGRIVTSRVGQDLLRGVFGTLFGGKR